LNGRTVAHVLRSVNLTLELPTSLQKLDDSYRPEKQPTSPPELELQVVSVTAYPSSNDALSCATKSTAFARPDNDSSSFPESSSELPTSRDEVGVASVPASADLNEERELNNSENPEQNLM
jgi:hypothetical protein